MRLRRLEEGELGWGMKSLGMVEGRVCQMGMTWAEGVQGTTKRLKGVGDGLMEGGMGLFFQGQPRAPCPSGQCALFLHRRSPSCPTWAASGACGSAPRCCLWWRWRSSSSTSWSSHSSCCSGGSEAGTGLQAEGAGVPRRWPPLQLPPSPPISARTPHPPLHPHRALPLPQP